MRRLRSGGSQRALLVGAGGTAKAAMYALSKVKGIEKPVLIYNRTTSRAEALAAEFGAQVRGGLFGRRQTIISSSLNPSARPAPAIRLIYRVWAALSDRLPSRLADRW